MWKRRTAEQQWTPSTLATIAIVMVLAAALLTGLVAYYPSNGKPLPTGQATKAFSEEAGSDPSAGA